MAGADNIKKHEFKKGQRGNHKGRPEGSKKRRTNLNKWCEPVYKYKNTKIGETEDWNNEGIIIQSNTQ